MKITVIGWYGTETIGDRAILAGLISLFNKSYKDFEINLGSLYPFFSERTINEDYSFYKEFINKDLKINIFNTQVSKELAKNIKESDLLVMGGGPLMDLSQLYMVEYAFKKAKEFRVTTSILGCGIGPLFKKKFRKSVLNIVMNSDIIILRDNKSKNNLKEIFEEFKTNFDAELIDISFDPAVECALEFKKLYQKKNKEYISINLREFPIEYSKNKSLMNINENLKLFVNEISDRFSDKEIKLIPMHYFHIGGDDRVFLNSIALDLEKDNIVVQNSNLTLRETVELFSDSFLNVGMRFHSIVLQTIVSGKNYVLDYTEPKRGKISGFIEDIDTENFFKERCISLQTETINSEFISNLDSIFIPNTKVIEENLLVYIKRLKDFT